MFWLDFLFFVALCSGLAWLVAARLSRKRATVDRALKIIFAGLLPTLLIVAALAVWQVVARYQYDHGPTHDGFMGPMAGLIYGFPLVVGNLVTNMIFAVWSGRSR